MIDCSEGTQKRFLSQMVRSQSWARTESVQGLKRISRNNLDSIFISHVHGDHMFGLFPLLSTMSMNNRSKPLKIFGPVNLEPILNFYKSFWGAKDSYELEFIPLKMKSPEIIYSMPELEILAFPLNHGIETFGFLFRETGPVRFHEGLYRPRSYAYCSDTAPFAELPEWVRGVDLLYHEATYMQADFRKAEARCHSTTVDAANCALQAGVSKLLAGHYSSAIAEGDIHGAFEEELRSIFPESVAVDDGDIFDVPLQKMI